jgi:DNA-binding NarL/FixJ family response regulator
MLLESATRRSKAITAYLLEPQAIFIPYLNALLHESGVNVDHVRVDVDLSHIMEANPDVLFIDIDFAGRENLKLIRLARSVLLRTLICVYANVDDETKMDELLRAGADCIVPKSADEENFLRIMRNALSGYAA